MPVILDDRTPTWGALRLERHVWSLKVALVPYFVLLIGAWGHLLRVWQMGEALFNACAWALALTYLLLVGEAFYIQKVMYDSAVYKHAAWQIVAGAVLLNPCVLGWWMPISVLLAVSRVRRELEAFERKREVDGHARSDVGDLPGVPRRVGASWQGSLRLALIGGVLLLLLFLAWHFAQIPKPR